MLSFFNYWMFTPVDGTCINKETVGIIGSITEMCRTNLHIFINNIKQMLLPSFQRTFSIKYWLTIFNKPVLWHCLTLFLSVVRETWTIGFCGSYVSLKYIARSLLSCRSCIINIGRNKCHTFSSMEPMFLKIGFSWCPILIPNAKRMFSHFKYLQPQSGFPRSLISYFSYVFQSSSHPQSLLLIRISAQKLI